MTDRPLGRALRAVLGALIGAGAVAATLDADPQLRPLAAALLGSFAIFVASPGRVRPIVILRDALILAILGLLAQGGLEAWHEPQRWIDAVHLAKNGGAAAIALYITAAYARGLQGRPLAHRTALFLLGLPLFLKALFLLTAPGLLRELAGLITLGLVGDPELLVWIGRAATLFGVAQAIVTGIGVVLDRRISREAGLHALLLGAAVFTAASPEIADWGSSERVAKLDMPLRQICVLLSTVVAQAALWSLVYLLTGAIIDALRGQRPTLTTSVPHWRNGFTKGAIYAGAFVLILQGIAIWNASPLWESALAAAPVLAFALAGALAFPLVKTVVESFDGSAPFLVRLRASYNESWNFARGVVIGAALGLLAAGILSFEGGWDRLVFGLVTGALAYAGVDLLRDAAAVLRGLRRHLQGPRVYVLGAGLGAVVGGALASYFDAAQVAVVLEKFQRYIAVYFPAAGFKVEPYVIYPLFSKWGATDLGLVTGGVRLFYNESLSGVINWSFAAPLFSINLVLLTALVQRRTAPIERLLTRGGFVDLVEQAFRVQRWGLWMAPVIYSFLRLAPEPSWYNQDGAIRSIVASLMAFRLPDAEFHDWSLALFLGLLAYDWLRVVIWFDHMGLRVATLVNASFVVGDVLDEKAARWLGHGSRTRIVPEGIRRFATWAPLLIPFYIPRGSEWDKVWTGSAALREQAAPLLPPVKTVLTVYLGAGLVTALVIAAAALFWRRKENGNGAVPPRPHRLSNGILTLEMSEEGLCHMHVSSAVRHGALLDLTRRPAAPSDGRGRLFYLSEDGRVLSRITHPLRVGRTTPTSLAFSAAAAGLEIRGNVTLAQGAPVAVWTIRIANGEARPRRLKLTSFREIALADWDSYERHPFYQSLFIGTGFVPALNAIIAHNRKLKGEKRREVFFHGVNWREQDPVRLAGYQDSRSVFLGAGASEAPDAAMLPPEEHGTAFTFDPAACLDLEVTLDPGGTAEICFADGYAASEADAAHLIARHLKLKAVASEALIASLGRIRPTRDRPVCPRIAPRFSPDGTALTLDWDTPRPWSHILANRHASGAVVTNDGSILSFARNSQQNALTPLIADSVPAQRIGQTLFVTDLATGEMESPGFVPFRRKDAEHEVEFARGSVRFAMRRGALALAHVIIVPPDAPVELRLLRLRNEGSVPKRYRVATYFEMVLAELPHDSLRDLKVSTKLQPNALLFENRKNSFAGGTAFVATSLANPERETWRGRFIGEGRDLANPLFAERPIPAEQHCSDKARIAAFAGTVDLPPGGEAEIALVLGQTDTPDEAETLIACYADPAAVRRALEETQAYWRDLSSALRIETDDPAFDRLVNDWLPYQVLASRLWGRLGPNQRSGGFGFRDQLQDVLPLTMLRPELARAQILLHASQQFLAGDVLQWWHADRDGRTGLGARNRASDPHLWLPYLVAQYIDVTGDAAILDEEVRYLEGMPIPPGQEGIAFAPRPSRDAAPLFDHCRRAIERTLKAMGAHGLPLMGTGDWNDGLSAIGPKGRGESVWLGFFLYDILQRFIPLSQGRGDVAGRYRAAAETLKSALEKMWRRTGFARAIDDGNEELLFPDALMASWPILSGAVATERGLVALEAARAALEKEMLVALLDPPFTPKSKPKPGRIADYPPGVRENGGQYSHGVSWLVDAHAALAEAIEAEGDKTLAARLRAEAARLWLKISPLGRDDGTPPHQQPADVYFGPGYEGRGGWSWYTGAAARMLWAAYQMLGIKMEKGVLKLAPHAFTAKGPIRLKRVTFRGRVFEG